MNPVRYLIAGTALVSSPALAQQNIVVPSGATDGTSKSVSGTDSVTVEAGGELSTATSPAIDWDEPSNNLRIVNSGIIRSTASTGSAIDTSGVGGVRNLSLTNNSGGLIEAGGDAFRFDVQPTTASIVINNAGTIRSTLGGNAINSRGVSFGSLQSPGLIITTALGRYFVLGRGRDRCPSIYSDQ